MERTQMLFAILLGSCLARESETAYFEKSTRGFSTKDLEKATSQIQTESVVECILHCGDTENSVMNNGRCYCMGVLPEDAMSYYSSISSNNIEEANVFKGKNPKLMGNQISF